MWSTRAYITFSSTHLSNHVLTHLPTYQRIQSPTYQHIHLPNYPPNQLATTQPAYLPTSPVVGNLPPASCSFSTCRHLSYPYSQAPILYT